MKYLLIAATLIASGSVAAAQGYQTYGSSNSRSYGYGSNSSSHYVQPHFNSNGSSTSGHYRSNPNNTQYDNFSTRGNVNPYTGAYGTRSPRY